MIPVDLVLYALLAVAAVAAAAVTAFTRSATGGALALGFVAGAVAGLLAAFAGAPLVAVAVVLLQEGVAAAAYLVASMVPTAQVGTARAAAPSSKLGMGLAIVAISGVVLALGIILLTSGHAPSAPGEGAQAGALARVDSLTADGHAAVAGVGSAASAPTEAIVDLLSQRYLVSFGVIGFVLLAALLGIVEANRVDDDPASLEGES